MRYAYANILVRDDRKVDFEEFNLLGGEGFGLVAVRNININKTPMTEFIFVKEIRDDPAPYEIVINANGE